MHPSAVARSLACWSLIEKCSGQGIAEDPSGSIKMRKWDAANECERMWNG